MTRSMSRWALAACLALAVLGPVLAGGVGSGTAEAAPSASPFAGTYAWSQWPAAITISTGGQISSSYSGYWRTKGTISGRVDDDGSYSFTVTETFYDYPERGKGTWTTSKSTSTGTMALDTTGNLVGTADTGGSFVWVRQ